MIFFKTIKRSTAGVLFSGLLLGMSACSSSDSDSVDTDDETLAMADVATDADSDILSGSDDQAANSTLIDDGTETAGIGSQVTDGDIDISQEITQEEPEAGLLVNPIDDGRRDGRCHGRQHGR